MKRQKHKGKKRPRSWHRSHRSSQVFYRLLREYERAEGRANS